MNFIKTKNFCPSRYHKEGENTSPKLGDIICNTKDWYKEYRKCALKSIENYPKTPIQKKKMGKRDD